MLCPQALIFVLFSMTHIVMDTIKQKYNSAFVKIWVSLIYTLVINLLCQRGLGTIAWFLILIPFVLMTTIVALILLAFGIDEANDELKIFDKENKKTVIDIPFFNSPNKAVSDININELLKKTLQEERDKAKKAAENVAPPAAANGASLNGNSMTEHSSQLKEEERQNRRRERNNEETKKNKLNDIKDETSEARVKVLEKNNQLSDLEYEYNKILNKIEKCQRDSSGNGLKNTESNVNKLNKDFKDIKDEIKPVVVDFNTLAAKWVSKSVKYVELAERDGDPQDKRLAAAQRTEANEYASNAYHAKNKKFKVLWEGESAWPNCDYDKEAVESTSGDTFQSEYASVDGYSTLAPKSYYMDLPQYRSLKSK